MTLNSVLPLTGVGYFYLTIYTFFRGNMIHYNEILLGGSSVIWSPYFVVKNKT